MKINITGRHIAISDSTRDFAEKKIKKIEKYFNQIIDVHLIISVEKLDHTVEALINGDGVQFHGREKAGDTYSSIDLLIDKMEKQIVKYKEKISHHKGAKSGRAPFFDLAYREGAEIRLTQASTKPLNNGEAFLRMQMDNTDFILFKKELSRVESEIDYANKNYAVIYRQGSEYQMIEIPFEKIVEHKIGNDALAGYTLTIQDGSASNPKIEFKKETGIQIRQLSLEDALKEIKSSGARFLPFFNVETQYFNVVYRSGDNFEVMVPAF